VVEKGSRRERKGGKDEQREGRMNEGREGGDTQTDRHRSTNPWQSGLA